MPKFIASGIEFSIRITVGMLHKVQDETDVDLAKALGSESTLAELLFTDPSRFVSVLYVLTGANEEPEDFACLFDGPALESAAEALLGALADFFPRSRVGAAMKQNLQTAMTRLDDALISRLTP